MKYLLIVISIIICPGLSRDSIEMKNHEEYVGGIYEINSEYITIQYYPRGGLNQKVETRKILVRDISRVVLDDGTEYILDYEDPFLNINTDGFTKSEINYMSLTL